MRREDDDDDEVASIASIETRGVYRSDDRECYDGYATNLDDDHKMDEAIEELIEKRYVRTYMP